MFIDIHNHIDFYKECEIRDIVNRAVDSNVSWILVNGTNLKANRKIIEMSKKYDAVKVALGIYPVECLYMGDEEIDKEIEFIRENKRIVKAIGEVGLDLKEKGRETLEKQKENLMKFVNLSIELDVPIIIHSRKAEKEAIELIEKSNAKKIIMHCFFGKMKLLERIIQNGWYLTVPSCVCYNKQIQELVEKVPLERIFCETDSPYMHPQRKKNNEPSLVVESYKKVSEIKGINVCNVEKQIEKNLAKLFYLS